MENQTTALVVCYEPHSRPNLACAHPRFRHAATARRRRFSALIAATAIAFAGQTMALGPRVPDPIPTLIPQGNVVIDFQTVADGLVTPVAAAVAPDDNKQLFVAEQSGRIWAIDVSDRGRSRQRT